MAVPLTLDPAAQAQLESYLPSRARSENEALADLPYPYVTLTYAQSMDAQSKYSIVQIDLWNSIVIQFADTEARTFSIPPARHADHSLRP